MNDKQNPPQTYSVTVARQDNPTMLTQIRYRLVYDSPESLEKLPALHEISLRDGTVTSTLKHGTQLHGEVVIMQQESNLQ